MVVTEFGCFAQTATVEPPVSDHDQSFQSMVMTVRNLVP